MTLPYGQNLTDANAVALVAYSNQFGLSAQNGECYFLVQPANGNYPRKELGLYPGIKAWRKKAKEQLRAVDPLANYKIDYEVIDPADLGIPPAKRGEYALCVRAKLTDDLSRTKYLGQFVQLMTAGLKMDQIEELIGKPPFWIGYGSVKVSEMNYLKMEPLRVAEKRAEKDATSRRFDLSFADAEMADDVDAGMVSGIESSITVENQATPGKRKVDTSRNMREMGFGDDNPPTSQSKPADTLDGEFHDEVTHEEQKTAQAKQSQSPDPKMARETAEAIINSKGVRYGDLDNDTLSNMTIGIGKGLAKPGISVDEKETYQMKMDAIAAILYFREEEDEAARNAMNE